MERDGLVVFSLVNVPPELDESTFKMFQGEVSDSVHGLSLVRRHGLRTTASLVADFYFELVFDPLKFRQAGQLTNGGILMLALTFCTTVFYFYVYRDTFDLFFV